MSFIEEIQVAKSIKNSVIAISPLGEIAMVRNNRFGKIVYDLPGGGQDVIATQGDARLVLEIGKPWGAAFQSVGLPEPFSQEEGVAILQNSGWNLALVPPFEAALQELAEEVSPDLLTLVQDGGEMVQAKCLTKRFLGEAVLPSLQGLTLDDLRQVLLELKAQGVRSTRFNAVLGRVNTFNGVVFNYTEKTDKKTPGRKGFAFYEEGCAVTLAEIRQQLETVLAEIQQQPEEDNNWAKAALLSSYSQFLMIQALLDS